MPGPRRSPAWTIGPLAAEGRRRLAGLKAAAAALESRVLLRRALGVTELEILAYPERLVAAAAAGRYLRLIDRRTAREPFAYLIGEREFWSIPISVGPAVLIPRPETETLVETALELAGEGPLLVADVGTGSGAVALALATELRDARVLATDISPAALRTARGNAARHGLRNIEFLAGDLCAPLRRRAWTGQVDLLVSNPPYVREADWARLQPEVRDYEPKSALVPGPTGLEILRRLIAEATVCLRPGGWLAVEIGRGQARAVRRMFGAGWDEVRVKPDLRGIVRVIAARFGGRPAVKP
ncbi:MAG: peptide chain release factor N(5)-glutamine methyltransferase [Candidatus Aminicenantes bacterium]|nr:peptide chain release factor N(5)-glutamine methyltransferase [Candidatus Aminicenantes bacterium]